MKWGFDMTKDEMVQKILDLGASEASIANVSRITFVPSFRNLCASNQCGKYGKCWACPPDCGDIHDLINQAKSFKHIILFSKIYDISDSFDIEGMLEAARQHNDFSVHISNYFKQRCNKDFLLLSAGACSICETCAKIDNKPCSHPNKAIRSLEAYGIAVSDLANICGVKYNNGPNTVTYFGAILL